MKRLAPVFVILAAALWGCLGIFVRTLSKMQFTSMEIVALRMWGAFLLLFVFLLLYKKKLLLFRLKDLWCFLGTGILSIVFFNFCYFTTIQLTSLSVAAILLYTAPACVTVAGIVLFHESFRMRKIVALFMAFGGCVFVTGVLSDANKLSLIGILTGLGSGVGYALYSIFGRYALDKGYSSLTISVYTFLYGGIASLLFVKPKVFAQKLLRNTDWIWPVLAMVLLGTIAAYVLYTIGLSYMEAGKASILASVEPVIATLMGFFLYNEGLDMWTIVGILLVLGSTLLVNVPNGKMS